MAPRIALGPGVGVLCAEDKAGLWLVTRNTSGGRAWAGARTWETWQPVQGCVSGPGRAGSSLPAVWLLQRRPVCEHGLHWRGSAAVPGVLHIIKTPGLDLTQEPPQHEASNPQHTEASRT